MYSRQESWGPKEAAAALEKSAGNRQIRLSRVAMYCRDMASGRWHLHGHGPQFGTDGKLYDGHHTCHAILRYGKAVSLWVTRDVNPRSAVAIDGGQPRSPRDSLSMAHIASPSVTMAATAVSLSGWPDRSYPIPSDMPTREELVSLLEEHKEALEFACSHTASHHKGWSRGSRGLIARAYYHVDHEKLARFCKVAMYPINSTGDSDVMPIVYGKFLSDSTGRSGYDLELERYRKGQTALSCFLCGRKVLRLQSTYSDLYPMPVGRVHANSRFFLE